LDTPEATRPERRLLRHDEKPPWTLDCAPRERTGPGRELFRVGVPERDPDSREALLSTGKLSPCEEAFLPAGRPSARTRSSPDPRESLPARWKANFRSGGPAVRWNSLRGICVSRAGATRAAPCLRRSRRSSVSRRRAHVACAISA